MTNNALSDGLPPFACPVHKSALGPKLHCADCAREYPAVDGVPVLINDANSVFAIEDYLRRDTAYDGASGYAGHLDQRRGLRQVYRRFMHRLLEADVAVRSFGIEDALRAVRAALPQARILVIGAGDTRFEGRVLYTDVAFGRNVNCIADAHDLPFEDGSFDACFAVAVLEHVADPQRCVAEIVRVLAPGGFVFAETPFMQPVHMGAYDFTRFTYLGHRRLFRRFDELHSGVAGGPATSAAQMLRYALTSLSDRATARKWLRLAGVLLTFPMRWLDRFTANKLGAYDSASGFYFFGRLRETPIADREILACFRGG